MSEIEHFATQLGARLKQAGLYLVTAESCTGGWLSQAVTSVPGSSEWFERGFVTYSNLAKQDLLTVKAATIATYGAVSEQTALEMVKGALAQSQAQVAVAITGVAGPGGGSPDKPVGTVWIAYAFPNNTYAQHNCFFGDRNRIREQAVTTALHRLVQMI